MRNCNHQRLPRRASANLFRPHVPIASLQAVPLVVSYSTIDTGSATSGVDYVPVAGANITFLANSTSQNVTLQLIGDTLQEGDEYFGASFQLIYNNTVQSNATANITILDDDVRARGPRARGSRACGPQCLCAGLLASGIHVVASAVLVFALHLPRSLCASCPSAPLFGRAPAAPPRTFPTTSASAACR